MHSAMTTIRKFDLFSRHGSLRLPEETALQAYPSELFFGGRAQESCFRQIRQMSKVEKWSKIENVSNL